MNLNMKVLFDYLRNAPFGGALTSTQVAGVQAILAWCAKLGVVDLRFIAYILATAFHETGGSFKPGKENLNYAASALRSKFSRERISLADADKYGRTKGKAADQVMIANLIYGGAWGLRNLGNKLLGDGWRFIGRGFVQLTGRRNYTLYGIADTPEKATEIDMAARIIVDGMIKGVFTGRKLAQYIVDTSFNAVAARAVVNGTDKASLIERHYSAILAALEAAAVNTVDAGPELVAELESVKEVVTTDVPAAESGFLKSLYSILGTGVIGTAIAAVTTPWAALALVALLAFGGVFLWGHLTGRFTLKRV